jgi:hypothetical protein
MSSKISFFGKDLWAEFENEVLALTTEALSELKTMKFDNAYENTVNYSLNESLRKIRYEKRNSNSLTPYPMYEAELIGKEKDEERSKRFGKKPDFQFVFRDNLADYEHWEISYCIECKRLGDTTFSRKYIDDGINRFIDKEWEYGIRAQSGAMIGYIQSSNEKVILSQVNQYNSQKSLNQIKLNRKQNGISLFKQNIMRKNIEPKEFKLNHLWVDLI